MNDEKKEENSVPVNDELNKVYEEGVPSLQTILGSFSLDALPVIKAECEEIENPDGTKDCIIKAPVFGAKAKWNKK